MRRRKTEPRYAPRLVGGLLIIFIFPSLLFATDLIPPLPPMDLIATAVSCGQIHLSWGAGQDEVGGSGLRAYVVTRNDPDADVFGQTMDLSIAADRTWFSDTNNVRSSARLRYSVAAEDHAGNRSEPTGASPVVTPACPGSGSQQVVDSADRRPLGRAIASHGARTALLYLKRSESPLQETWLYVHDEDANTSSRLLLHRDPGYRQMEADYLLTSATELWTISHNGESGGAVIISQYRLDGAPMPSSATLVSTKEFGSSGSIAKTMIQLKSGALMVAWNDDFKHKPDRSVDAGFAYRNPAGLWTVRYPVSIPTSFGESSPLSRIAMAQHPSDDSVWVFDKRDSFGEITALHFTEAYGNLTLNWMSPWFINRFTHGYNRPHKEFPFLTATPDRSRNAILLGYQNRAEKIIYQDSVNPGATLRETGITIASIGATGSTTFFSFPDTVDPKVPFGLAVSTNGAFSVTYTPIKKETLTWNEVYSRTLAGGVWSPPRFVGYDYGDYLAYDRKAFGEPALLISRADKAEVAFLTPDLNIRTFVPSAIPAVDVTAPGVSITSPSNGATVSGTATVTVLAVDNVAVTAVSLLVDGASVATRTTAPYTFEWDTSAYAAGPHTLIAVAHDASGNPAYSAAVTVAVDVPFALPEALPETLPEPLPEPPPPSSVAEVLRSAIALIDIAATDDVGVTRVDIDIDGIRAVSFTSAPYLYEWVVPSEPGPHVVTATAYDAAGNSSSSTVAVNIVDVPFALPEAPPPSSVTEVLRSTVLRSTIALVDITAADDVGVTRVDIDIDGARAVSFTSAPYLYEWVVPSDPGPRVITATAYDAAGNSSSSTVEVNVK